jgi:hypothetical protein
MKTSVRNQPVKSALLRIAARVENLAVFQSLALSPTPFADLMLYPDKLEAVLKTLESWKQRAVFAPRAVSRMVRSRMAPVKNGRPCRQFDNPLNGLKNTEFHLEAPAAGSVKLAADFTDWEKSPLDLIKSEAGVWFTIVPLLPGNYTYRFIVDGEWCDDPRPAQRVANPFGTTDAVVNVI